MIGDSTALNRVAQALGILNAVTADSETLQNEVRAAQDHCLRFLTIASGVEPPAENPDPAGSSFEGSLKIAPTQPTSNHDQSGSDKENVNEELIAASKAEVSIRALVDRGSALKSSEILAYFREIGQEHMAEGGTSALNKQLRRRAANTRDILQLPGKPTRWDLVERYSSTDLVRLISDAAFAQDKEREELRRRTKEGLQRAKEERGYQPGPAPKINLEQALEIRQMLKEKKTAKVIAKKYNVTPRTIYLWSARMKNWNPETDPFPPPNPYVKKDEDYEVDLRPSLRLVGDDD